MSGDRIVLSFDATVPKEDVLQWLEHGHVWLACSDENERLVQEIWAQLPDSGLRLTHMLVAEPLDAESLADRVDNGIIHHHASGFIDITGFPHRALCDEILADFDFMPTAPHFDGAMSYQRKRAEG